MAALDDLYTALKNADAAGDTVGAKTLATYIQSYKPPQIAQTPQASYDPTADMSTGDKIAAGAGSAITNLGLGIKQRFLEAAKSASDTFPSLKSLDQSLTGTNADERLAATQADIADKRRLDAPLMATTAGKVGSVGADIGVGTLAALAPGGQSLAGALLSGGAMGAAEPTMGNESALKNAKTGAVMGGAGYGLGKLIGYGAGKLSDLASAKAAANSVKDANTAAMRDAGYAIPVSQSNPGSVIANTADIVAGGRPKMAQAASIQNQQVTNALAGKALGVPENTPITPELLNGIRDDAFNAGYAPLRQAGMVTPGPSYTAALDSIDAASKGASRSFPDAVKNGIEPLIDSLRVKSFDAGDAVDMTRILRETADKAYRSGDNALGKASKQASNALEDAIQEHLSQSGSPDAVKAFQDARTLMAKTYSVQKALNPETGNISAANLGAQLKANKPLDGELLSIAKAANLSPTNMQTMKYATPGASQLEGTASVAGAISSHNPLLLGIPYARAKMRQGLLSDLVQKSIPAPSYGGSTTLNALGSDPGRALIQGVGASQGNR